MTYRVIVIPESHDQVAVSQNRFPYTAYDYTFRTKGERDLYVSGMNAMADLKEYEIGDAAPTSQEIIIEDEAVTFDIANEAERSALLLGLEEGDGWLSPKVFTSEDDEERFAGLVSLLSDKERVEQMSKRAVGESERNEILSLYRETGITLLAVAMAAATSQSVVGVRVDEDFLDVRVAAKEGFYFNPASGVIERGQPDFVSPEKTTRVDGNELLSEYPGRYSDLELATAVEDACKIFGETFRETISSIPKSPTSEPVAQFGL